MQRTPGPASRIITRGITTGRVRKLERLSARAPSTQENSVPLSSQAGSAIAADVASPLAERFAALRELFDPGSIRRLGALGVGRGWHCLEVGGGGGSIAAWLSERVGPRGRVVVTDIRTQSLEQLRYANLEVLQHNVVTDPLPEGEFDLVHARLLLGHLPEREVILKRMVAALKPGAWLLDEEFDGLSLHVAAGRAPATHVLRATVAMERAMARQGVDLEFGQSLLGRLRDLGLSDAGADAGLSMWTAGSAGACVLRSYLNQFREPMIKGGHITADEFEHDWKRLDEPDFFTMSPTLWGGRVPAR